MSEDTTTGALASSGEPRAPETTTDTGNDQTATLIPETLSSWQVFKHLSRISLPRMFSYTFSAQVYLFNLMLVALSEDNEELASIALIITCLNSFSLVADSPIFALSVEASKLIGKRESLRRQPCNDDATREAISAQIKALDDKIAAVYANGLMMVSAIAPFLAASYYFSGDILTHALRQRSQVADDAQQFLRAYAPASPAMLVRICNEQLLFSLRDEVPTMIIALSSLFVGLGISATLGFGWFGLSRMGFAGVAVGGVTEAWLTAIGLSLRLGLGGKFKDFNFFHLLRHIEGRFEQLGRIVKLGGAYTVSILGETLLPIVASAAAGFVGTEAQAAWTFAMQLYYLLVIPILAFSHQNFQELSRYIGAGDYLNAYQMGRHGILTTLTYITPTAIVAGAGSMLLSRGDGEVHSLSQVLLPMMFMCLLGNCIRYNVLQQLKPLGNRYCSSLTSLVSLILGMVAAVLLSLYTNLGVYGVGVGFTGGILLAALLLLPDWWQRVQPATMEAVVNSASSYNTAQSYCCFWGQSEDESRCLLPTTQSRSPVATGHDNGFWQRMGDCSRWLGSLVSSQTTAPADYELPAASPAAQI
ncbi:MAG: hypothetical protein CMF50_06050 [Legionellales bacterium]|nr:hypothetical protein [Legionellales bacterium]|tara:strand:+ start:4113 stop:5876 length:1764 start_codon:yes stop_codon:yes gene_type:complete